MHFGEAHALAIDGCDAAAGAFEHRALDRARHGATDQAVKPMVVAALGPLFPLVDSPPTAFGFHAVFRREMFGQESMVFRTVTKQRKAATISHRDSESGVDKTPHATLYSAMLREISTKGKDARFKKTERGKFAANG